MLDPRARRRGMRHLAIGGLALWLAGCAGLASIAPPPAPAPALTALPEYAAQPQRLVFEHGDERHVLLGVLRHDRDSLRLALLSPQGQRLLTLIRDSQGARFQPGGHFEPPFSADWLADRLAWSLWPVPALHAAFAGSDWQLLDKQSERHIVYRNNLIARIGGDADCRIIDDIQAGYRLYISPLSPLDQPSEDACPGQ